MAIKPTANSGNGNGGTSNANNIVIPFRWVWVVVVGVIGFLVAADAHMKTISSDSTANHAETTHMKTNNAIKDVRGEVTALREVLDAKMDRLLEQIAKIREAQARIEERVKK